MVVADLQDEARREGGRGLGEGHGFVAPRRHRRRRLGAARRPARSSTSAAWTSWSTTPAIEITSLITEIDAAQDIRTMLEVNILGTALGIKHGLRAMRPGGAAGNGGSIINVASVAATIAFPGIAIYSGTKSAVDRLTRVAAMEAGKLGYGVRVNCIYPGLVPTAMGAGLANDVAELGLFASAGGGGRRGRRADPRRPARRGRRHGRRRGLPGLRRLALHHRRRPAGRRRNGDVTMNGTMASPSSSTAPPATPAG